LAAGLVACSAPKLGPKGGQSGSEELPEPEGLGGASTVPCPCGNEDALRVTLLAQDHGNLRLRVEAVLHGDLPLSPGDEIEADRDDDSLSCFRGCASLELGEQAFAFYRASAPLLPVCEAREACIAGCLVERATPEADSSPGQCACRDRAPADQPTVSGSPICGMPIVSGLGECQDECSQETAEECLPRPEQDYRRGSIRLSPWQERIVFARTERGELSLARDQLALLWSDETGDRTADLLACTKRVGDWSKLLVNPP
jgi:hypothetical protein